MLSKRDRDKRKDGDIYTVKVTVFPLNGSIGERKSKKDWERKSENNTFQSIFIIKTSLQSKSSWNKTKFNVWCDLPSQGIKVLLSFTVFQNIMAERTPNSSDALPIIGQHFLNASTKKNERNRTRLLKDHTSLHNCKACSVRKEGRDPGHRLNNN